MNAVGPMSIALETARTQLAACASYRAFVGATDAAGAKDKTYLAALPKPTDCKEYTQAEWENTLRPFGMIYTATQGGFAAIRSALYAVRESGRMFIELEITIPTECPDSPGVVDLTADDELADRWILNQLGSIVAEFMALAGQPGYLDVSSVTVMMGPSRERFTEQPAAGQYYWTLLEVTWGATE